MSNLEKYITNEDVTDPDVREKLNMLAEKVDAMSEQNVRTFVGALDMTSIKQYGYIVETERYRYCLRCKPQEGDYDGYLWCFDKKVQEMNMAQKEIVGRLTFANGDVLEFTDPAEYVEKLREEIDFISTTGMKYETLTDDPQTRKAVDDIVCGLFGEENPRPLEDYTAPSATMQMKM